MSQAAVLKGDLHKPEAPNEPFHRLQRRLEKQSCTNESQETFEDHIQIVVFVLRHAVPVLAHALRTKDIASVSIETSVELAEILIPFEADLVDTFHRLAGGNLGLK